MSKPRILMVDDNPTNLKLVRVLLGAAGYELRAATSGAEVLRLLPEFMPQLILMDIQLPDVDGLILTHQLKAEPAYRDIAVVALTANAMKGDIDKALACGCSGYITKPIDTRSFVGQVGAFLAAAPVAPP
jgi:two-component system cell cycle response regulator DivK